MFGKVRQFLDLPNSHKLIFTKISLIVPLVELGIKTFGFKRTFNLLKRFTKKTKKPVANPTLIINRHRNFLYLYSKQFPFFGKCLAQSLTLWVLLQNKSINTDLRFGMKKENNKFLAHAWLEYDGKPLATEEEQKENYLSFNESILTKIAK